MKNLNDSISVYQSALRKGDILDAYRELVKLVMRIRTELLNENFADYNIGNVAHGYLDYTYFYYTNDFLKSQKLKLGFVLNHIDMRFEIWLLGNTQPVQQKFWQMFKDSAWAAGRSEKPEYAIIEAIIADNIDFSDLDKVAAHLKKAARETSAELQAFLELTTH